MSDYDRIAAAMAFIAAHRTEHPSLEEIAAHVHLSPFHFQRLFCRWAGTTPKRFQQALTLERGKVLMQDPLALLEVADAIGLSGSSRLHDHFVQFEAVSPGEHRARGRGVAIRYGVHPSPFGPVFVAMTDRGVCRVAFLDFDDVDGQLNALRRTWPLAGFSRCDSETRAVADALSGAPRVGAGPLSLHVAGTNFQIAVWRALLRIPEGVLASYSQVAAAVGRPDSARAIGNAVGANPVAFLIPCHRVILQNGALGGYRWGTDRKLAMQLREHARSGASAGQAGSGAV